MSNSRDQNTWQWWEWVPVLLILPAYFMNLGLMPLWADEPTRALVALEMELSGNYLAPTIMSEWYLNKPPLYNWILLGFYHVLGYTEFATRLPAMLSLAGMCGIVYWAFKPEVGRRAALAAALSYVTFGRMAWYSSHLGHIDPLYADLIFFNIIWIYRKFRNGQYWSLFLLSYLLVGVAFLMKGLPTLVFQALTLLVLFINGKKFRVLFGLAHFAGIALFLIVVGSYFNAYFQHHIPLQEYWDNLINENVKRTAIDKGFLTSVMHIFKFPADQLFLFLPFSLFVPMLFSRGLWASWWRMPFLRYTILVVAVNIPLYWLSPDVRPRYLFMLYPFVFLWLYLGYEKIHPLWPRFTRILHGIIGFLTAGLGVGIWAAFWFRPDAVDTLFPLKIAFLSIGWLLAFLAYLKIPDARYFILFITLLLFKLAVQWVVLPYRYYNDGHQEYREMAQTVGELTKGEPLYVPEGTPVGHSTAYYITKARGGQIQLIREESIDKHFSGDHLGWMIYDGKAKVPDDFEVKYQFNDPWRNYPLYLGKIVQN